MSIFDNTVGIHEKILFDHYVVSKMFSIMKRSLFVFKQIVDGDLYL